MGPRSLPAEPAAELERPTAADSFRAMGSEARITVVGTGDTYDRGELRHALRAARRRLEQLELCWSRFIPTSDVSRLNTAQGRPVVVDRSTIELVVAMVQAWWATDGAFDPTLLGALVGLGYASDWDDPARVSMLAPESLWRGTPDAIVVDTAACVVTLPVGTTLDGGGIGKGLAADLAVATALEAGADGALVSIGGDLRAGGHSPQPGGWTIGVADPRHEAQEIGRVRLLDGGVATSGTLKRRWTSPAGLGVHHLLDPSTGCPARTRSGDAETSVRVVQATVIAGTGAWAEAWTKAVIVLGAGRAFATLDRMGLAAMVVGEAGDVHRNAAWAAYDADAEPGMGSRREAPR